MSTLFLVLLATITLTTQGRQAPPNIVVVLVDNVRADEFGVTGHPYLKTPNIDRLAREGALFSSFYVTTSLCSPSRASIMTGQYASRHGIIDNSNRSRASHELRTFATDLKELGYETAFLGKWHMGNDATPRPGWDYWLSYRGQGEASDPELYEDGGYTRAKGYITDIVFDRAIQFVRRPRGGKPFLLYVANKAVHPDLLQRDDGSVDLTQGGKHIPAPRHATAFTDATWPSAPNWLSAGSAPAPGSMLHRIHERRAAPEFEAKWGEFLRYTQSQDYMRGRARMLLSVDEGLGKLLEALSAAGALDRTVIILTSDNGEFLGAHGLTTEIRLPYEEALRVPFLVRYPGVVKPGTRIEAIGLNIDIAPTLIDLAGGTPRAAIQGRSLLPLLRQAAPRWRTSAMYELTSEEQTFPWLVGASFRAVRMGKWKYIQWTNQENLEELYDLERDPFELTNRVGDPALRATVQSLRTELARLAAESLGILPR